MTRKLMYANRVKKMCTNKPKKTPGSREEGPLPPTSNSSWRRAQGADDSLQPFSWKKAATITLGSPGGRAQHQTKGAATTKGFLYNYFNRLLDYESQDYGNRTKNYSLLYFD